VDRDLLPLLNVREVKRSAYVVVTSDKGLAGSFNSSILRKAQNEIDVLGKDNVDVFCIGKKARDHFKVRGYNIIETYVDFWGSLNFNHAIKIGNGIVSHFLNGHVDEIHVVYNEFVSVATQMVLTEKLLPLDYETGEGAVADRLYEPSKDEIVKSLVPRHLNVQMWKYLLESYSSEQAARMVAMENATSNSEDMIKNLTLEFNKARQAAITTEMLEIVSGAEALK
jgi:F-type H+-transporting ATPase subunit gamma